MTQRTRCFEIMAPSGTTMAEQPLGLSSSVNHENCVSAKSEASIGSPPRLSTSMSWPLNGTVTFTSGAPMPVAARPTIGRLHISLDWQDRECRCLTLKFLNCRRRHAVTRVCDCELGVRHIIAD